MGSAQIENSELVFKRDNAAFFWGVFFGISSFLLISAAAFYFSQSFKREAERENQSAFLRSRTVMQNEIEHEVSRGQIILYALRGFFEGSELVTREEFNVFNTSLQIRERYPSLYTIAYLKLVKDADLADFVRETRKEVPDYSVFPTVKADNHYVVFYDYPIKGTKPLRGLDAMGVPEVVNALTKAADTGLPAMSETYTSLADPRYKIFLMVLPIFENGKPIATALERKAALSGFAVAIFLKDNFFNDILARLQLPGLSLEVFDGEMADPNRVIFDSDLDSTAAAGWVETGILSQTLRYGHQGHVWTILYTFHLTEALMAGQVLLPNLILYGGLILALLFSVLILILVTSRTRALGLVAVMTTELQKFKLAVDSANSHIILTDPDGKILYVNPAAETVTGYTVKEMLGNNPRLWGGLMGREFYEKMWHQIKEERRPWKGELKNRRKNGEIYNVLSTVSPILDENKNLIGFVGLEDDITAKVQANEALAEAKAKDEAVLASIGDGVVVVDASGRILMMNKASQKLLGWKFEEVAGRLYFDTWHIKDGLGNVITGKRPIELALAGETTVTSESYITRKDGSDFPAHITASPVVRGDTIIGVVMVFRDIAAEKAIDRAKTEFVSLASHQLRTPLSAVSWYAGLLLNGDLGPIEPNQRKYVEEIYESNKRMVELVNALLNVSRIDLGTFAIEPAKVNLVEISRSVVAEISPQIIYKKLTFSEDYNPNLPEVSADPKLARIIIQNLVTNAVKYNDPGGKAGIEIGLVKAGQEVGGKKIPQDGFLIRVFDTGYGIPEDQKGRVFDKLFRADNVREKDTEGTGLGLYIVLSIVKSVSGLI